jgi:hypothetical protein
MQIELQYHKEYAAITGSIGRTPSSLIVEATGLVGSDAFA